MYSPLLTGLVLVAFQLALYDCAPGLKYLSMDIALEGQHDVEMTKRVEDCKDERSDCPRIVEMTGGGEKLKQYCNRWKDDPAVKQCRLTCKMCQEKAPSPTDCKDERSDCPRIVQMTGGGEKLKQYCNRWKDDPAVKQCLKTCNMCVKPPSPPSAEPETVAPPETQKPATQKPTTQKPATQKPTTQKPTTQKPTAAPPQPTRPSGGGPTGFQRTCLEAHNDYRSFHRAPPLTWSADLTRDAQAWANHLAASDSFDHDPTARSKDQGENLYYMTYPKRLCDFGETGPDCFSCREVVKMWYDEELDYDYVTGEAKVPGAPVLHFTQIVWKATKKLGMATAVANNRLVAVARYSPVGNNYGQFQENVLVPDYP